MSRVPEASLVDNGHGLEPAGEGWYVVNVADAAGWHNASFGSGVSFETKENSFEQFGINIQVLQPGQPNCRYHSEVDQESFLVLAGECILVVEHQERRLRVGDFFHCPAGTGHVFVGGGDGPCAILMVGARQGADGSTTYEVSEPAGQHEASVAEATTDSTIAYSADAPYVGARVDFSWILGA